MAKPHFTRGLFDFLKDLEANNNRDWFQANKDRYEEHLKQPALRFIGDFGPHVRAVSPAPGLRPRPSGGSLFRIYRDVRFSKDKSPYKTHCAIQFRHEAGKDAHAPGLYLHLEPANAAWRPGIWRPTTECRAIREAIAARARALAEISAFARTGCERFGEQLKRVPTGYAKDHPAGRRAALEGLRRVAADVPAGRAAVDALERIGAVYRQMRPMLGSCARRWGSQF